ncbi:stage 0 sporulation family protein [Chloroflexota bacterium]
MAEMVGIRFKRAGRVYHFDPAGIPLEVNDYVVVDTSRGLELGRVVIAPTQISADLTTPLKPVVRKAEDEDIQHAHDLENKEIEALVECSKSVAKMNLPMKLLSAEYSLSCNRVTIFFSAEERVDFRNLVRQMTKHLNTSVELRQVGPRDEAKLIGGFGRCGRPLCCASFLGKLTPVSIKMAKEQNLPLNPMKISGICGRLLCCLGYESDQYHTMKEKMPKEGDGITTPMGTATIVSTNPIKETLMVKLDSQAIVELPLDVITVMDKNHKSKKEKIEPS